MPTLQRWLGRVAQIVIAAAALQAATVWSACPTIAGNLQQGGLVWAEVAPGSTVKLDGKALDVLADGTTMAGFGRDFPATAELVIEGSHPCRTVLQVQSRDYPIQRVEGVPSRTVTPPEGQLQRIRREAALVKAARQRLLPRPDLLAAVLAGFGWPVQGPISGVYGSQRYYNGEPRRPHYGLDVAVPTGTPVRAPAAGVVTLAEPNLFFSGGTVILDHGYRLSSSFLHLSEVQVAVGDELKRGDLLGAVGASGRASGPHLDWRMNWRDQRVDPQLLVSPMPTP